MVLYLSHRGVERHHKARRGDRQWYFKREGETVHLLKTHIKNKTLIKFSTETERNESGIINRAGGRAWRETLQQISFP